MSADPLADVIHEGLNRQADKGWPGTDVLVDTVRVHITAVLDTVEAECCAYGYSTGPAAIDAIRASLLGTTEETSNGCAYCLGTGWVEDKNWHPGFFPLEERKPNRGLLRCGGDHD